VNPKVKTPALDALQADGVTVSEFYTYRFCSPSRGAFLTGRLPWQLPNSRINFLPATIMDGTPLEYNMLPARLKPVGYKSHWVGKCVVVRGGRWALAWPEGLGFRPSAPMCTPQHAR
jgi:arylsulfatase A-like enzyme